MEKYTGQLKYFANIWFEYKILLLLREIEKIIIRQNAKYFADFRGQNFCQDCVCYVKNYFLHSSKKNTIL